MFKRWKKEECNNILRDNIIYNDPVGMTIKDALVAFSAIEKNTNDVQNAVVANTPSGSFKLAAERVIYNLIGRTDLELNVVAERWDGETCILVSARLPNGNIHRLSCRENDFPTQEMITKLQMLA